MNKEYKIRKSSACRRERDARSYHSHVGGNLYLLCWDSHLRGNEKHFIAPEGSGQAVGFLPVLQAGNQQSTAKGSSQIARGRVKFAPGVKKLAKGRGETALGGTQMAKGWLKIVRGLREIAPGRVNCTSGRGKSTSGTHQARVSVLTAILAPTPDRVPNPVRGGNMTLATIHGVTASHTVKNERYLSGNRQLGLPADMFFNN